MSGGFTGKYAVVDLTTGSSEVVEPGEEFYKKYLSGYGLGAAVITTHQKTGIDPLAPESYLGFCSGLLPVPVPFFPGALWSSANRP